VESEGENQWGPSQRVRSQGGEVRCEGGRVRCEGGGVEGGESESSVFCILHCLL
jgi:hypothetical protein